VLLMWLGTSLDYSGSPRMSHSNHLNAQVAELVDALASGASDRKVVEVQVLSWAPCSCVMNELIFPYDFWLI
jgi:hypothetical protein